MIEVVTISSKGQLVIPKSIREEMGLRKQDKFLLVHDRESVILRRLRSTQPDKKLLSLLDEVAKKFEEAKITPEQVKREIRKVRAKK